MYVLWLSGYAWTWLCHSPAVYHVWFRFDDEHWCWTHDVAAKTLLLFIPNLPWPEFSCLCVFCCWLMLLNDDISWPRFLVDAVVHVLMIYMMNMMMMNLCCCCPNLCHAQNFPWFCWLLLVCCSWDVCMRDMLFAMAVWSIWKLLIECWTLMLNVCPAVVYES